MSPTEVIEKISSLGLREYGAYNDPVTKAWEKDKVNKVIAALNNNDTDKILLDILRKDADKVLNGMVITAIALGTKAMELYLPEGEEDLKNSIEERAKELGITIYCSFLDVRKEKDSVIHHIETMAAVSDIFDGEYKKEIYIAIKKDDNLSELKKIPFGTKISDLIDGDTDNIKAVVIGTMVYDKSALDMAIDENLSVHNGIIAIITKDTCMIQEAYKRTYEIIKQGCGKCTFCREGLLQLNTMEKEITEGKGKPEFVQMLTEIGEAMPISTLCSVGQTGSDFVLGTLKYFDGEYVEHIKKKNCPAGACTSFMNIYIDPHACTGCEECADVCPEDCIEGKAGYIHMIDEFDCTKCGKCMEVCEENAIIKTSGRIPKLPASLTKCGRFRR